MGWMGNRPSEKRIRFLGFAETAFSDGLIDISATHQKPRASPRGDAPYVTAEAV
ncbi:TPA: hypothetical protein ACFP4Y_001915 [Neisseria bacilliformis]|uniref:hypothetical protein n=1 Tax=Neisseria bacilliformis TaxID=267212 RepID=UPI001364AD38|nr:hypothetical protein [Neisseria bacilliformis]